MSEFKNPTPVGVGMVPVEKDGEIFLLGCRRNIEPKLGEICLTAGYIDEGETSRSAARREVEEESGLILDVSDFKLFDEAITPQNRLLIFNLCQRVIPHAEIDFSYTCVETQEVLLIDANTPIAFPLHKQAIERFYTEIVPEIKAQIAEQKQNNVSRKNSL